MKLDGVVVEAKYRKDVTFSRPDGKNFTFKIEAAPDTEEFTRIMPRPEPPLVTGPNKAPTSNLTDPKYLEDREIWSECWMGWVCVTSLTPSNITWDAITSDPTTFPNWIKELTTAGFSSIEVRKLQTEILIANGVMTAERVDDAIKNS